MRRLDRWLAASMLVLLSTSAGAQDAPALGPSPLRIDVLDVGQGDAILIRSPEGKSALVDAGPSHHIVTLLRQRGVRALDLVAVSHHHADHYGGMLEVVKQFRPRVFLASNSSHSSEHYLKLLEEVRDQGIRAIAPSDAPRRVGLGPVVLTIFPQAPQDPHEENNNSVGLRVDYGDFSMLLPGDAEREERRWWEREAPTLCAEATVLKLAHHGSRNGSDAPWLELVRPRLAIASLGKENEFGHPHGETLALLARLKIPLLRTDQDGTVAIESDGLRWHVSSHPHVPTGPPLASSRRSAHPRRAEHHARPRPSGARIDLNAASEGELRTVPGIGEVLARRIIAGRPYRSVDELSRIEGIGKKRLEEFRPFLTAE